MAVASLANIPTTDAEMAAWSFAHMAHHRDLVTAIFQTYSINLPVYVLDPVDLRSPAAFLDQHQLMHNAADAILGVSGYDLTDVNWQDSGERAAWIWLNFQNHYAEALKTEVW